MIHAPNAIAWQPGDLVLHDADAKRPDMLMVVLGRIKTGPNKGKYRTRYFDTNASDYRGPMHRWSKTIWRNDIGLLHDPNRFGMRITTNKGKALDESDQKADHGRMGQAEGCGPQGG